MCAPLAQELQEGIELLLAEGLETLEAIGGDIAKPGVTEASYDGSPLRAAKSLSEAMVVVNANLGSITCPTLVCTSPQDHVVPPATAADILAGVSGPVRQVLLERSYHVATLDYDADLVEAEIFAHVESVLGGAA
jgi:carboxylesterase